MSTRALIAALDELVPEPVGLFGDWDDVLRRADIAVRPPSPSAPARSRPRRRWALPALAALVLAVLFATPAFGVLRDLIGRIDLPFGSATTAPYEVRRSFFDLSLGAPSGMAPEAIASQARRVGVFHANGKAHVLYVAPTRKGGFCDIFSGSIGGCRASRNPPARHGALQAGDVHPFLIGVSWMMWQRRGGPLAVQTVGGDIVARGAATLRVEYEDGTTQRIAFVWVSKPIDAGFFLYGIPMRNRTTGHRPHAVAVFDARGRLLARQTFAYRRLPAPHPPRRRPAPRYHLRTLPAPVAPFQRGSASGLSVVAGANGSVDFDTSGLQSGLRALLATPHASFGCFRFMRYHWDEPAEAAFERQAMKNGRIQIFKPGPGYDGCEAAGAYGHRWPDRFHSHAAAEIAFTARGRRFFADRAAARDLALYVRSRRHLGLGGIRKLSNPTAPLPAETIGYAVRGATTTYVERSTTGRRFTVALRGTKIVHENVKPLALVF